MGGGVAGAPSSSVRLGGVLRAGSRLRERRNAARACEPGVEGAYGRVQAVRGAGQAGRGLEGGAEARVDRLHQREGHACGAEVLTVELHCRRYVGSDLRLGDALAYAVLEA